VLWSAHAHLCNASNAVAHRPTTISSTSRAIEIKTTLTSRMMGQPSSIERWRGGWQSATRQPFQAIDIGHGCCRIGTGLCPRHFFQWDTYKGL
jgi:hypothetical protein